MALTCSFQDGTPGLSNTKVYTERRGRNRWTYSLKTSMPVFFWLIFLKWRFPRRLTSSRWQSRDNWNIPSEGNWDVLTHLFWQSGKISLTNLPYKTFFKQLPNFQTQNWRSKYTTLCWKTVVKKSCQLSSSNALSPNFPNFFLSRGWQKSRDNTALIYTRWPPNLLTIPCRITKKLHVE